MAFEIMMARMASAMTSNYVMAQSLTLSIFIVGMGCGSYLFGFLRQRTIAVLVRIEIILFLIALPAVFCVQAFHVFANSLDWPYAVKTAALLGLTQVFVFAVAVLAGMEIPFFNDLARKKNENRFGLILALSYFGTFAASFATVAWWLPQLGFLNTFNCILILVLISCYLLSLDVLKNRNYHLLVVLLLSFINAGLFKYAGPLQQIYLKNYYYGLPSDHPFWQVADLPRVDRHSTPYQEIDVVPDPFTYRSKADYFLYIDQKLQYASAREVIYHESMVVGAINLHRRIPKKVLILGGGEGLVARELLINPETERIDLVELDQAVLDLARSNELFVAQNKNALSSPRVHVHVADAYMWIKNNSEKYDAVFIDLPHPFSVELSRLFSSEFFTFVKRSLTADGFVIFDYPANHIQKGQLKYYPQAGPNVIYNTLKSAGFQNSFTYGPQEAFIYADNTGVARTFVRDPLLARVHPTTRGNLKKIEVPDSEGTEVNSIFKPYFLTE